MTNKIFDQKKAAKEFAEKWAGRGDEKQDTHAFWISLLRDVFGVTKPEDSIQFEKRVKLGHTSFIDAYIPETKVLIEQKSIDVDLLKEAKQSDGSMLTPYQQADRYRKEQNYSEAARWIVTCNFKEFFVYDMDKRGSEPEHIFLKDLPTDFYRLQFLVDSKDEIIRREEEISWKAGELVGRLYDAILKQYKNPESAETLKSLNILCVRLVFLLYAEDAGIFPEKDMFGRYLAKFRPDEARKNLMELFTVLNTKPENRDPYLNDDLAAFPYVNGGLFAEREIEIPRFNEEIVDILVNKASAGFDWSEISPTIFGAVFESTLNPETRRKGGMHYTSIANIHKVIDSLFLDGLWKEFYEITGKKCPSKLEGLSRSDWGVCQNKKAAHSTAASGTSPNLGEELRLTAKQRSRLEQFRNKIASLKFLDPACGSGNFLTETYISLRRLENEILKIIHGNQQLLGSDFSPIKVKISQFYGIEINDFAVTVAKTALWIAESQMMKETEEIVDEDLDFLPLSTSATIVEGNALRMDWRYLREEEKIPTIKAKKTNLIYEVREPEVKYEAINLITDEINVGKPQQKKSENHYDYIMGNPPFVGNNQMSKEQRSDLSPFFPKNKTMDYVACWYVKTAELIQKTSTKAAFVSTNSITQGEQVAVLWELLLKQYSVQIDFAWQTFRWKNETADKKNMAAVHCVVIGFSCRNKKTTRSTAASGTSPNLGEDLKQIFNADGSVIKAKNINPYILDCPDVLIGCRSKPLCDVSEIRKGNQPTDGGNLIIDAEDYEKFIKQEPSAKKYIKNLIGAKEFINNIPRYCLWLVDASPAEIRKMPLVLKRIEAVRKMRLASSDPSTVRLADTPALFRETNNPDKFIVIPSVSSENRQYVPIGFLNSDTIPTNLVLIIPNASLYHFGVLTSSVHMAWMRAVCGRLESRYRYSKDIVYNNFPWPDFCRHSERSEESARCFANAQHDKIEQTAQAILDARAKYPDSSLADLYDETTMPPDLRKAHKENDKAVMAVYGFNQKMSEAEIVAELFKMYEKLTKKK